MTRRFSFSERGGWWVAVQVPLLIGAILLPPRFGRVNSVFEHPAQLVGWVLVALAAVLVASAFIALGRALTPFPRPRDEASLVTAGIYRFVRHPIYAAMIVGTLGWALAYFSLAGVFYTVIVALFFDLKVAREERWLRQRFPEYDAYAQRVRKFIPGVF